MTKCPHCRREFAQHRGWTDAEDAVIREFSGRGAPWISTYRLPKRTAHSITARRLVLERQSGERLPRAYQYTDR
ncbi:hypothetical protein [Sphingomonas oryzagri]|uniref:Uncharacterized protein n=1 Tax=Sphingomonas oryzagri TaxID=3042314 RepID=A0ABT6N0U5_9SPHN|nr:hypothetical protein [Sphingomonas oryzagri]MDH7638935.1 hypothetical protein [Sphingomonas oryzagri]